MSLKWTVRNKLLTAFGAVLLMVVILVIVNWSMMSSSIEATELARDKGYAGAMLAAEIKFDATQVWQWLTDVGATRTAEGFDEAERYATLFRQDVAALRNLHFDNQEELDQLSLSFEEFYEKGQWMAQQYVEGGPDLGNVAMDEFDIYAEDINSRLDALVAKMNQEAEASIQAAINRNVQSQSVGLIISGVAVVFAIIISLSIARSITTSVDIVARAATGIAGGDLNQRVEVKSKDELGDMATAFQRMIAYMQQMAGAAGRLAQGDLTVKIIPQSKKDMLGNAFTQMMTNLRNLISQVQQSAEQVASASQQLNASSEQASQASQQVAATSQQVARGTAQQTQSVTEATGNVEQMARAAEGIAQGAQEQAKGIQKTSDLITEMDNIVEQVGKITNSVTKANDKVTQAARHGVSAVEQTGQGMDTIRARTTMAAKRVKEMGNRSKEIGRIVETIDEIADKTDMLALNAAVEAARAGEHGRGFAVVADQVRKLSEDSKNATGDIADLIERVQETISEAVAAMESTAAEVDNGIQLAGETTASLQEILEAAEEAAEMAERISEAAGQLRNKSRDVVTAVDSVSTVVEENTAVAEEMAANSQEVTEAREQRFY
jgi:methyl-accepting chemotaxis protein